MTRIVLTDGQTRLFAAPAETVEVCTADGRVLTRIPADPSPEFIAELNRRPRERAYSVDHHPEMFRAIQEKRERAGGQLDAARAMAIVEKLREGWEAV